jgi:RNA recognition motif-containing protein
MYKQHTRRSRSSALFHSFELMLSETFSSTGRSLRVAQEAGETMNEPTNTLYFKNIDWKVKKPLLKRALYALGTRHGKVMDVIVLRRDGLRGQAWVVFETAAAATACLQAEQGFEFFGKAMVIEFARDKTKHVNATKESRDSEAPPKAKKQKKDSAEDENEQPEAREDETALKASATDDATPAAPPSKYLLATDLPAECNQMTLSMIFRQYDGFKEVRMPREGMAFVEFDTEASATVAINALQGFQLTAQDNLKLQYGKE